MLPTINILNKEIALYGLMILLGVVAGTGVAITLSKKRDLKTDDVLFTIIFGVIGLAVGAKLLFFLVELPWIIENFSQIIQNKDIIQGLLSGGFVFYGGLIGGLAAVYYYCRRYKVSLPDMFMVIIPILPLVHSFGRIGCFFAGCCYGIEYSGFGSIIFKNSPVAPNGVPLFPVQLVESFINILIFIVLMIKEKKTKSYKSLLGTYILLYSLARFILEFFRGDIHRGIILNLSTSQWISMALFLGVIIKWFHTRKYSH